MKVQCSVLFEDEKSKSVFMSNVRKLGTADEKFKSISIVHDMTKRERELSKEKVKHATEKNEENESGGLPVRSKRTSVGKESCENEGQEVGRRRGTYVNNVNALGNGNQQVNKLNDFSILYENADSLPNKLDELNKGNNKITEHRAILLKSRQNQSTTGKLGKLQWP